MASESSPIKWDDPTKLPGRGASCWPLAGYAPGEYTGKCSVCEKLFFGLDKRAYHCLPCAIEFSQTRGNTLWEENKTLKNQLIAITTAISTIKELFK